MRSSSFRAAVLLGVGSALFAHFAIACSASGDGEPSPANGRDSGGDGAPTYAELAVEPPSTTLAVQIGSASKPTQTYKAFAKIDGQRTEITDRCSFSVSPDFGTFSGAVLTAGERGGVTKVQATCQGSSADASLTIDLAGAIFAEGVDPGARDLFDKATEGADATKKPVLEYPLDGAVMPQNLPPIEVQWARAGHDLFRVRATGEHVAVDFYTKAAELPIARTQWQTLIASTTGANLAFAVEGLTSAAPSERFTSGKATLIVAEDAIDETAIYYWSSSKGMLMTSEFGQIDEPTEVKGDCTSCHALSRTGRRAFYSRSDCARNPDGSPKLNAKGECAQGAVMGGFMKWDPTGKKWVETLAAPSGKFEISYGTFVPPVGEFANDDKSLLVGCPSSSGELQLYDPDTATIVPSNIVEMSTQGGRRALMPDWSPDGKTIVYTSNTLTPQWCAGFSNMQITTMGFEMKGGTPTFAPPKVLVAGPLDLATGKYDNFFFPVFDPSGLFIVFNGAKGAWLNQGANGSAITDARLLLTTADGSGKVDLANLNGPTGMDNTWARWAPNVGKKYQFLIYSTQRPYGHLVTPATRPNPWPFGWMNQWKQLWIAAIDIEKAKVGAGDPSAPPLWLPGQAKDQHNLSPFWTKPTTVIK